MTLTRQDLARRMLAKWTVARMTVARQLCDMRWTLQREWLDSDFSL